MSRKAYPDDLTDKEWTIIAPILAQSTYRGAGAKPVHPRREMLNAIFYVLRTGCAWRHLPHDFPVWDAVYAQFRRWRGNGIFLKIHTHLRRTLRVLLGKAEEATAGIVDSQSIKTTEKGGSKGMMEARKSKAGRGISLSIP